MGTRTWTDEQFIEAVKTSDNLSEVGRKMRFDTHGANTRTIKKYIKELGLDTSHFLSTEELRNRNRPQQQERTNEELFSVSEQDRKNVKRRIIRDNLIPYSCAICALSEWMCGYISLHLDHINGNGQDNRLENLRFLCPNCHSQTDTYCGKKLRKKEFIKRTCATCGTNIHNSSTWCRKCLGKSRKDANTKIVWSSTDELLRALETKSFAQLARDLGVSDNIIRKRLRRAGVKLTSIKKKV